MGDTLAVCPQVMQTVVSGLEAQLLSDATQPPILPRIARYEGVIQEHLAGATTLRQLVLLVLAVASSGLESRVLDGEADLRVH